MLDIWISKYDLWILLRSLKDVIIILNFTSHEEEGFVFLKCFTIEVYRGSSFGLNALEFLYPWSFCIMPYIQLQISILGTPDRENYPQPFEVTNPTKHFERWLYCGNYPQPFDWSQKPNEAYCSVFGSLRYVGSAYNMQRPFMVRQSSSPNKLLTKSKETFLNPVYLLLFNTLFVYGIYKCKAEIFLFKMTPQLQWLHVAGLDHVNENETKSQIKCAKISIVVLLREQSNWHCNSNKQDNLLILIHFIASRRLV